GLIAQLVAVAFSLAGCTIFPLFLLGIWWSGSNRTGAWAGLMTGSAVSAVAIVYFIGAKYGWNLPGATTISYYLNAWYFAWLGAPLAIIANIIGSKLSKEKTPDRIRLFLAKEVHGD
ncbi:MAG: cation acetate symporter, partial [Lentisphaerota bacterium]